LRVDFLRGIALLTIFIDHVPKNRWATVTQQNFGYSDAAELFVVLAGFSAVLAYGRYFDRDHLSEGIRRIALRIGTIYVFHLGTLVVIAMTLAYSASLLNSSEQIEAMSFEALIAGDPGTIAGTLLLVVQPKFFDILPLYIVLLAAFPMFYLLMRWNLAAGIAASAALWLVVQVTSLNLPTTDGEGWYFNPFAWQILLVLGMAAALRARKGSIRPSPWLVGLALTVLVVSLVLRAPWTNWPLYMGSALVNMEPYGAFMQKSSLGPARLVHIMAFGYLLLVLVPPRANWLKKSMARTVADAGSNSLEVFCLGIVLSVMGGTVIGALGRGPVVESWVTTVGVAALLITGIAIARDVRTRKRARSRTAKAAISDGLARA
jgi:hypothetical protein